MRPLLSHYLGIYLADLNGGQPHSGPEGEDFDYPYLDLYWTEPERHPFFIEVGGEVAGFVLVNTHTRLTARSPVHAIAEFFIRKRFRRQGIGRQAVQLVLTQFPGAWEVVWQKQNLAARNFWPLVLSPFIADATLKVQETPDRDGEGLVFDVGGE